MSICRSAAVAAVAVIGVAVAGCGSSGESPATTASTSGVKALEPANVAYLSFTAESFVHAEEKGMKSAVVPGGGSVTLFNANFDQQKQFSACQDAITSGRYNVIALEAVETASARPCVQAAQAAKIPVIGVTNPIGVSTLEPIDGVAGQVVITPDANGRLYSQAVKVACEGLDPCNAIAEIPVAGDPNAERTLKIAQQDVPSLRILQKVVGNFDPSVITKNFPDALTAHPDANVFLGYADTTALAVVPGIKSSGRSDFRIVGSGATKAGVQAVADGTLAADTASWPFATGKAAGEMAIKAVNGQPIQPRGVDALTLNTPNVITKDNAGQVKAEW